MKPSKIVSVLLGAAFGASFLLLSACGSPPDPIVPDSVALPEETYVMLAGDPALGTYQLAPVAALHEKNLENAAFEYTVSDPEVASVDETGLVTALSAGRATVTATFVSEAEQKVSDSMTLTVYSDATSEEINSFGEEYVNLYGRMDNDTAGELHIDNVGSGVEVAFYGTELKADFTVTPPPYGQKMYGHIFIDGEMQPFAPIETGTGLVLATGLKAGIHTVGVYKSSEINEGRLTVRAFYADRFLKIPEKSDLKMEFIGDSITCGYGDLLYAGFDENGNSILRSPANSDACAAYAFLTGKMLGADFDIISYSGICVSAFMWGGTLNMEELHTYASLNTKTPFRYKEDMDVVVLNLGTNDGSYIDREDHSYRKKFPTDYQNFLTHLRAIYPEAYIVCIYGMMGLNQNIHKGIQTAVEAMNDAKIVYTSKFAANTAAINNHPHMSAQKSYAETLTKFIQDLLADGATANP